MNLVTPSLAQFNAFNPDVSGMATSHNNTARIICVVLISISAIGMIILISKSFSVINKRMVLKQNNEK